MAIDTTTVKYLVHFTDPLELFFKCLTLYPFPPFFVVVRKNIIGVSRSFFFLNTSQRLRNKNRKRNKFSSHAPL